MQSPLSFAHLLKFDANLASDFDLFGSFSLIQSLQNPPVCILWRGWTSTLAPLIHFVRIGLPHPILFLMSNVL